MDLFMLIKLIIFHMIIGVLGHLTVVNAMAGWVFIIVCIAYAVWIENYISKANRRY